MPSLEELKLRLQYGRTGRHRPATVRTGVLGLIAIVVAAVFGGYASVTGYMPFLPRGGNMVGADFSSAFNLNTSTPVRIKGITVGEVDSIKIRDGGRYAHVNMRIDDRGRKLLRSDARAAVWSRLVLGGTDYIELTPGRAAAPLGDTTIPRTRTTVQVGVDEVLNAFTPTARLGLKGTITGLKTAFSNPAATSQAVDALDPGLRDLAPAVAGLRGRHDGDLGDVVKGFDRIVRSVGRDEAQLGGIVDGADATLGITAARRDDIARTLRTAPAILDTTRTQLAGVDRTLAILGPLATDLQPGAQRVGPALARLRPALTQTKGLLRQARPLVAALNPTVTALHATARQGKPLIDALQPTVSRTKDSILPFLHATDPHIKVEKYQLIGPTVAAVDSLSGLWDSHGHVAAFNPTLGARALHDFLPCDVYLTDPDPSRRIACQDLGDFLTSMFTGGSTTPKSAISRLVRGLEHKP